MNQHNNFIQLLKRSYFFSKFTDKELIALMQYIKHYAMPRDTELFLARTPGEVCYVIVSGSVRLLSAQGGKEYTVRILSRGDSLGESILLREDLYQVTAKTDTDTELLSLHKNNFELFLKEHPDAALRLSRLFSRRVSDYAVHKGIPLGIPEVFMLYSSVDQEEYIPFAMELSLSLSEQTKRKVLLLELSRDHHPPGSPKACSMHEVLKKGLADDLCVKHGSGMEYLRICTKTDDMRMVPSFFYVLREKYDFVMVTVLGQYTDIEWESAKESNKILFVFGDDFGQAIQSWKFLKEQMKENEQPLLRVHLKRKDIPAMVNIDCIIPLHNALKETSSNRFKRDSTSPAIRAIQRLARRLGHVSIGVAMGAGSAFGFAIIGILKVMERYGIYPDIIAGTSMGALIGAYYVAGKTIPEIEEEANRISKLWLWKHLDFAFPRSGVIYGDALEKYLRKFMGDITFANLTVPFSCVATDINNGKEVIINEGPLYKGVRSSISIPVLLEPHFNRGCYVVDGGLVDPVPSDVLLQMGADIIISINLIPSVADKKMPYALKKPLKDDMPRKPGIIEVFLKAFYTMQHEIARRQTHFSHVIIAPDFKNYSWMEFHRAQEFIDIGEKAAEEAIPKIKSYLPYYQDIPAGS